MDWSSLAEGKSINPIALKCKSVSQSVKHMFPPTTRLSTFPLYLHEYSIFNFKVLEIHDCEISYLRDNFKTRIPGKILALTLTVLRAVVLFSFQRIAAQWQFHSISPPPEEFLKRAQPLTIKWAGYSRSCLAVNDQYEEHGLYILG